MIPATEPAGGRLHSPGQGPEVRLPTSINNPQAWPGPSPENLFLLADNLLQLFNLILFAIKYIFLLYNVRLNFCGGDRQGGGVVPISQAPPELRFPMWGFSELSSCCSGVILEQLPVPQHE